MDGHNALKKAIVELYKLYDNVRTLLQWNRSRLEKSIALHSPSLPFRNVSVLVPTAGDRAFV